MSEVEFSGRCGFWRCSISLTMVEIQYLALLSSVERRRIRLSLSKIENSWYPSLTPPSTKEKEALISKTALGVYKESFLCTEAYFVSKIVVIHNLPILNNKETFSPGNKQRERIITMLKQIQISCITILLHSSAGLSPLIFETNRFWQDENMSVLIAELLWKTNSCIHFNKRW